MSLFSVLRRLYRPDRFLIEDFHTEIVAQVLRNSDALTLGWLHSVEATSLQKASIKIETQKTFAKLAGHSTDSRPDITIKLSNDEKSEFIFVESKVPSKQGEDQLQRYTDHLVSEQKKNGFAKASLIYITRDYETVVPPKVGIPQFQPALYPTRWFQFYKHLQAHANGDGLAKELMLFMKENHMSLGNQFRSTDLVAMENFISAKALMDETLDGEVLNEGWKILGNISTLKKAQNQLRDHHRYILYSDYPSFECLIGYWLPYENPDDTVWVGITLASNPGAEARNDVIEAFRNWLEKTSGAWSAADLDDENEWGCIYKGKEIHALMGGNDHVRAIKDHLLGILKEVEVFRKAYPKLPWGVINVTDSGDAE